MGIWNWNRNREGGERGFVWDANLNSIIAAEIEGLLELNSIPSGGTILDFGCGNGAITKAIARANPHLRFLGIDRKKRFQDANTPSNLEFRIINNNQFSFKLQELQGIYSYSVFQYVPAQDLDEILSQFRLALAPGSKLLIGEVPKARGYFDRHLLSSPIHPLWKGFFYLYLHSVYRYEVRSEAKWKELFQNHGFHCQTHEQDKRLPYAGDVQHWLAEF